VQRRCFQSGSVGRQFTAAAIVMLSEEGRLGLDDPLRRHLPEGPDAWDAITLRHLLTHTSGIPDYADSTLDYRRDYTEDDLPRLGASLPAEAGARAGEVPQDPLVVSDHVGDLDRPAVAGER
jgi:CubicO group peptidase (beta-lactamase class C family)